MDSREVEVKILCQEVSTDRGSGSGDLREGSGGGAWGGAWGRGRREEPEERLGEGPEGGA